MYLHSGADLHPFQETRHLGIGDSDAAFGPVQVMVDLRIGPAQPMYADVPSEPGPLRWYTAAGMGSFYRVEFTLTDLVRGKSLFRASERRIDDSEKGSEFA